MLSQPRQLLDSEFGLDGVLEGSYLPVALERLHNNRTVSGVLLSNFHLLTEDDQKKATITLIQQAQKTNGKNQKLFLLTTNNIEKLPEVLFPYVHIIRGKKPDINEIHRKVEEIVTNLELSISNHFKREIVSYLQGFHSYELEYLFHKAKNVYENDAFDENKKKILELIGSEKVKMLERKRLLEWQMVKNVDMANMENLTKHLHDSGRIMSTLEDAIENGVDVPKGILIMGLPGTGKSLFAQYAASLLKMPLIRLEMGKMMGGHVGDSERNLRNAQKQAAEMAPCILWIDEIEKGFAGSGKKQSTDSGYLQRMTGGFLTWLQEKKDACYIIATANSIEGLPPEFFRKGRFDECFYTTMPSERELREILKVHLMKEKRKHVESVAEEAIHAVILSAIGQKRFMTGADAGALVSNVFRRLYLDFQKQDRILDKKEYDRKHLEKVMLEEFENMKVFSETNAKDIAIHDEATKKSNFVSASIREESSTRYNKNLEAFIENEKKKMKE